MFPVIETTCSPFALFKFIVPPTGCVGIEDKLTVSPGWLNTNKRPPSLIVRFNAPPALWSIFKNVDSLPIAPTL